MNREPAVRTWTAIATRCLPGVAAAVVLATALPAFANEPFVNPLPQQPGTPPSLTEPLRQALESAAPDELVPVSVILREQVSRMEIRKLAARPNGPERRTMIADRLKEVAIRSQSGLLQYLRAEQAAGRVGPRLRPLWISNIVGVDAVPDVIREIARRPEVVRVNYNPKVDVLLEDAGACVEPFSNPAPAFDPLLLAPGAVASGGSAASAVECGTSLMRAPEVWGEGNTGQGAVIAVIDTGVCWSHPDIINQIWVNPGEDLDSDGVVMDSDDMNGVDDDGNGFVDDLIGWDFDDNDNDPNDTNSHGSHVAGTVAGDGTSGTQAGMAPDAEVMAIRVGVTFADEVDVWNGMQYAADNGADSISMSLGWPHNQNPDRATWRTNCENTIDLGTAMVIAAGNEGSGNEPDNVRTPGDVPRIISVGATDCSDNAAGFSSRGPVTWQNVPPFNDHPHPPGLIKPDVSAPGVSTESHNFCSGYSFKSGTSMATPHAAGAVALMVASDPSIEHDEIKQFLEDTAIELGPAGKDNTFGSGRIDAFEAADEARPKVRYQSHRIEDVDPNYGNNDGGVDTGETISLIVTVKNETDHVVSDVRAFVTTTTPGVRIRNNLVRFPDLNPSQSAESLAPHLTYTIDSGCFFDAQFRVEVRWDEPVVSKKTVFQAVGTSFAATMLDDDFESDQGWTASSLGGTDGFFVRADPNGTSLGPQTMNPEDDHTASPGTDCWVSGNDASGGASGDDIDGGSVALTSPVFDASDYETLSISYWRWFAVQPLFQPGGFEFLRTEVSNDGGSNWTVLESFENHDPQWTQRGFTIDGILPFTSQMRFRFVAEDGLTNGDQTVEAAVDDFLADGSRVLCDVFTEPAHNAPHSIPDTMTVTQHGTTAEIRYDWSAPPTDATHDAATFYRVWRADGPDGPWFEHASPTTDEWAEPNGMDETTTRYFRVSAANSGGDSPDVP